jgi:hypothetical protein
LAEGKAPEGASPKKEEPALETSDEEYDRVMDEYSERIRAKK